MDCPDISGPGLAERDHAALDEIRKVRWAGNVLEKALPVGSRARMSGMMRFSEGIRHIYGAFAVFAVLLIIGVGQTRAGEKSRDYIWLAGLVHAYQGAFERCRIMAQVDPAEVGSLVNSLSTYPAPQVEKYLLGLAFKRKVECEQPQLGELAWALLLMRNADGDQDTLALINATRELVFPADGLKFMHLYDDAPANLKSAFDHHPRLTRPFDASQLLDLIPSGQP